MAQDRAAVTQVGGGVQQVVAGTADLVLPERHDLHQPARVGDRDRIAVEVTLDLDDCQDQVGRQADARRFHVHELERLRALFRVRQLVGRKAPRHVREPDFGVESIDEARRFASSLAQGVTQLGIGFGGQRGPAADEQQAE